MQTLILRIGGLAVLIVLLGIVVFRTDIPQEALTIFADQQSQCRKLIAEQFVLADPEGMVLTETDLNADDSIDYVVKLESNTTCGSGGCVHELCVSSNDGGVKQVSFGFAAHKITVLDTLTDGMRDLMVNDDPSLQLRWNGYSYELSQ